MHRPTAYSQATKLALIFHLQPENSAGGAFALVSSGHREVLPRASNS